MPLTAFNLAVQARQLACLVLAMPVLLWVGGRRQQWRHALPGLGGLWISQRQCLCSGGEWI